MAKRIFIDTNVFINLLNDQYTKDIMKVLDDSSNELFTCFQVLNELKCKILISVTSTELKSKKKYEIIKHIKNNKETRIRAMEKYLEIRDIIMSKATVFITNKAIDDTSDPLIIKNGLLPTDAIIISTMTTNNINEIFSDDSDFDKIENINRIAICS